MSASYTTSTSVARYDHRVERWRMETRFLPGARHHAWWLLHNVVSHPLLGISTGNFALWLHDWTSQHLNRRGILLRSEPPVIPAGRRRAWVWHNVVGHLAIGLLPVRSSFEFHDRTARAMNVEDWV